MGNKLHSVWAFIRNHKYACVTFLFLLIIGVLDENSLLSRYHNLKQMLTYIRTYLVEKTGNKKYANLPIIIGGISHKSKQWSKGVEDAQHRLAQEDKNIYVVDVPNASLCSDVLHFDAEGAQELGNKMFQLIEKKKLLK